MPQRRDTKIVTRKQESLFKHGCQQSEEGETLTWQLLGKVRLPNAAALCASLHVRKGYIGVADALTWQQVGQMGVGAPCAAAPSCCVCLKMFVLQ